MKSVLFRGLICILLALPLAGRGQFIFTTNANNTLNVYQYTGSGGDVTIPDTTSGLPVTSIGSDAFNLVSGLTSLTLGTNIANIGTNAVFQCANLAGVSIPASVTNIGLGPFYDCQKLTVISLSTADSYFTVTNGALYNKALTSLIQNPGGQGGTCVISAIVTNVGEALIGNSLTAISVNSSNAYYSSTNGVLFDKGQTYLLEYPGGLAGSYSVPHSVSTIESAAFEYSFGVTNVVIDTNVTSIGYVAFYDSAGLTGITVSSTNAYYSSTNGVLFNKAKTTLIQYPCAVGGSYNVPDTVTNIEDGAFGDASGLTVVVIPDSVTSIGVESFYSCLDLAGVSLGNHIATIGVEAFFACTSLTDLTIPNSTTNIAQYAFYYCPALASVTFGDGISNIGSEAFGYCENLANVCFSGKAPVDGGSIFYYDLSLGTIDYVSTASGWGSSYDGFVTTPVSTCGSPAPNLHITLEGTNVVLTWQDFFSGYTLQSAASLGSAAVWSTVSPAPVDLNSYYTVTNSVAGTVKFYRLIDP